MRIIKSVFVAAVMMAVAACATTSGGGQDTAVSFDAWNQIGTANWRIENGAFVADAGNGHLVTKESYRDFEISLEFWADEPANSGIFFRASDPGEITDMNSYEANIFDTRPDQTYRTGGVVHYAAPSTSINTANRWNTYIVRAEGNRFTVILNGITTVEMEDDTFAEGPIALQYAAGEMRFRNIRIRRL